MKAYISLTIISVCIIHSTLRAQEFVGNAEIFEPGVISLDNTWDEYISFSPDGNLLSFTRQGKELSHSNRRIYFSEKVNGKWSKPSLAPFSGYFSDRGSSFSPDGKKIFFGSNRPRNMGFDNDYDIWYSEKDENGNWSEAKRLDDVINSDEYNEGHPYVAKSGNLYFVRYKRGIETDIYVSKWINGKYQNPEKLNSLINTVGPESHCYIDPDERFLILGITNRDGGMGAGDIYISYNINEKWTSPINLGSKVNTDSYEYSAKPGPNNRLYFTRARFGKPSSKAADIYSIKIERLLKY